MQYWFFGMPGSGKSYLGRIFSHMTGYRPYDGDDFQTDEDRSHVREGTFSLERRHAQLARIMARIEEDRVSDAIITHPLPDKASRVLICAGGGRLVYVKAPVEVIRPRLASEARKDHHFRPEMLDPWIKKHWQEPGDEPHFAVQNDRHESLARARLRQLRLLFG